MINPYCGCIVYQKHLSKLYRHASVGRVPAGGMGLFLLDLKAMRSRKIIKIAIIVLLSIWLIILIFKPRGFRQMERIAKHELQRELTQYCIDKTADDFLMMPIKESTDKSALIFNWLYFLEMNDTVVVTVEVKKQAYPWQRGDGINSRVNSEYRYINKNGHLSFENLLPYRYENDSIYLRNCVLYKDNDKYLEKSDTIKVLISSVKLFAYLKKGYFDIKHKSDNYTFISFYQSIAELNNGKIKFQIRTANVFFNSKGEVLIVPANKPHD